MRINRINIVPELFLLSLRTSLSGNKITWTETFARSKKFIKWQTFLNRETVASLACYENLPIKTHHRKSSWSFLCVTVTPLPLQISRFRSVHRLSSNNSENANHGHLSLNGTDHSNSLLFWKYSLLENQSLISELKFFLKVQGSNFQVQFWLDSMFPLIPIISSCENSSCV